MPREHEALTPALHIVNTCPLRISDQNIQRFPGESARERFPLLQKAPGARLTLPALATSLPADPSTGATNVSILTPAMQAAIGRDGEPRTTIVERGAIERFAAAIGDDNPAYPDVAPPTFLRSVGLAIPALPDSEAVPRVLDGGSEWTYGEPVRPGDAITFVTQMETLIEREGRMGSMLIATYVTRYTNQRGELAAAQRNTLIRMPAA